jgi:membrane protein required for colicin V production
MYIDLFLAISILIGLIQGYHKGIVRTLFSILSVIIGFLAALKFSPFVVSFFERVFDLSPLIALIAGMVITFLLFMLGIRWLGNAFEKTLKLVQLNIFNKLTGAALFAALMIFIYSVIIWFCVRTEMIGDAEIARSRSYPVLSTIPGKAEAVAESLKPVFRGFWQKLEAVIVPPEE